MLSLFFISALASRCLQLVVFFIPKVREHFDKALSGKSSNLLKNFEKITKVKMKKVMLLKLRITLIFLKFSLLFYHFFQAYFLQLNENSSSMKCKNIVYLLRQMDTNIHISSILKHLSVFRKSSHLPLFFQQDYDDHIEEINNKLVSISENMAEAQVSKVFFFFCCFFMNDNLISC